MTMEEDVDEGKVKKQQEWVKGWLTKIQDAIAREKDFRRDAKMCEELY